MREIKYISAQPATDYFAWQVEVYLHNFISMGIHNNQIDVVASFVDSIPENWISLQARFPKVRFCFYRDTDPKRKYLPSIQPHILKQHFARFPELTDMAVFYHDCDFVFTKPFDFSPFLEDNIWYFSDTRSYMGARYIESKGTHKTERDPLGIAPSILDGMARVFEMCPCIARAEEDNTGGAQKLMKGLTSEYWEKVEIGANNLYSWLIDHKDEYGEGDKNDIQIWTAGMWSELWTAWKSGTKILAPKEFDFCWATDVVEKWDMVSFFHNAGVVDSKSGLFFKGGYTNKLPYGEKIDVNPKRCSSKYFDLVQSVGKESVLL